MPEQWRTVVLGDVAKLNIHWVTVESSKRYRIAGVLNSGQGMFERGEISGSETNYQAFHELQADQVVMRKLTAWEGPVTVVPRAFEGYCVSTEFPTFDLDRSTLLPEYMAIICQHPPFWQSLKDRSTGTVQRRKRVSPKQFLSVTIKLPPVSDQRRIIDLLSALDEMASAAKRVSEQAERVLATLRQNLLSRIESYGPLSELCSIESKLVNPTSPEFADLPHLGIERIESASGRLLPHQTARQDGVKSAKFFFSEDDVVLSKIRPNLRKATFPGFSGLCSADAYPLRPHEGIMPSYLLEVLLSDGFTLTAVSRSSRTKMPKINRSELFSIQVPIASRIQQKAMGDLLTTARFQRDAAERVADAGVASRKAALSELLSSQHRIPQSYDHQVGAT